MVNTHRHGIVVINFQRFNSIALRVKITFQKDLRGSGRHVTLKVVDHQLALVSTSFIRQRECCAATVLHVVLVPRFESLSSGAGTVNSTTAAEDLGIQQDTRYSSVY